VQKFLFASVHDGKPAVALAAVVVPDPAVVVAPAAPVVVGPVPAAAVVAAGSAVVVGTIVVLV